MKYVLLLTLVFLLSGCSNLPSPVYGGALRNTDNVPYFWRSDMFPVTVSVDQEIETALRIEIYNSCMVWNRLVGSDVFEYQEVRSDHRSLWNPGMYGHIGVTSDPLGNTPSGAKVWGRATPRSLRTDRSGALATGHIELEEEMPFAKFESVTMHELGHTLGLAHNEDPSSLMYPTNHEYYVIDPNDIAYVRLQTRGYLDNGPLSDQTIMELILELR